MNQTMRRLPQHEIQVYHNPDLLPADAEILFATQLAGSSRAAKAGQHPWRFALVCAVTPAGRVLGGVHLDIGPIGGAGPLAKERLAYLERTFVRPEYRQRGLATRLLQAALRVASEERCLYVRCSNNWNNPAERQLLLRSGFALVDLNGEADEEPCYLAVKPLRCP
jgi:GNAT superfamily N-acetyltransferase